jgi:hypothetical protein
MANDPIQEIANVKTIIINLNQKILVLQQAHDASSDAVSPDVQAALDDLFNTASTVPATIVPATAAVSPAD